MYEVLIIHNYHSCEDEKSKVNSFVHGSQVRLILSISLGPNNLTRRNGNEFIVTAVWSGSFFYSDE